MQRCIRFGDHINWTVDSWAKKMLSCQKRADGVAGACASVVSSECDRHEGGGKGEKADLAGARERRIQIVPKKRADQSYEEKMIN